MNVSIWLIIALITFSLEVLTPGTLVSIWFTVAALITALASVWMHDLNLQIAVFLISTLLAFLALRPLFMRLFNAVPIGTNVDRLIGQVITLTEAVTQEKWGAAQVLGLRYSISTESPMDLPVGTKVEILRLEGARLVVRKSL